MSGGASKVTIGKNTRRTLNFLRMHHPGIMAKGFTVPAHLREGSIRKGVRRPEKWV